MPIIGARLCPVCEKQLRACFPFFSRLWGSKPHLQCTDCKWLMTFEEIEIRGGLEAIRRGYLKRGSARGKKRRPKRYPRGKRRRPPRKRR